MACKDLNYTVNDKKCYSVQWPADKAFLMKFRLLSMIGPALTKIGGALGNDKSDDDQLGALGDALTNLFMSHPPEEVLTLIKDILEGSSFNGTVISKRNFNELFADDLTAPYIICANIIKLNYADVLDKMQAMGKLVPQAMMKNSQKNTQA